MKEYQLQGLTCPHCADRLAHKIKQLSHGETAQLNYPSGKLKVDADMDLKQVQKVLKSEQVQLGDGTEKDGDEERSRHKVNRELVFVAIATVIFLLALGSESFSGGLAPIALYVAAIVVSGHQTFLRGLRNLLRLQFTIDTLMTVALIGAVLIGEWKEGTMVALLFGLNEYLEGLGMDRARRSLESLLQVAPKHATVLRDGQETTVPLTSLKVGDTVVVRAGEQIPSDGVVCWGRSSVNEAVITGESLPVEKETGADVFGGSINNEGALHVRTTKAYEDSALAKILHLVEEAQDSKTPTELFVNRFAKYYTPLIMGIAALVMTVPPLIGGGDWMTWVYQGLAVLIVGCPCALILSSPIANLAGMTRNARHGILVKGSAHLEQLGQVEAVAFDKTGTLTKGKPRVAEVVVYDKERFLPVAVAVESLSSHPLAKAIIERVGDEVAEPPPAEDIVTLAGRGVMATVAGQRYWVGNEESVAHVAIPAEVQTQIERLKAEGLSLVLVADHEAVLGMFGLGDDIREESRAVVAALHRMGLQQTVMLTGDHERTANKVARAIGLSRHVSHLLPEEKVAQVQTLAQRSKTAMVGDGINDAPALATADLGIAMGKGTDSAIETADVVLMQDHLGKLPQAIAVAKRVNRIVRLNIGIALGLKLFALLLTIPGLLTLWIAIMSDMGATVLVTVISLTVLWERKTRRPRDGEAER